MTACHDLGGDLDAYFRTWEDAPKVFEEVGDIVRSLAHCRDRARAEDIRVKRRDNAVLRLEMEVRLLRVKNGEDLREDCITEATHLRTSEAKTQYALRALDKFPTLFSADLERLIEDHETELF